MVLICPPRKITAAITTIAMRARMRAYSARPCPSSSRRTVADSQVMRAAIVVGTSFPSKLVGVRRRGHCAIRQAAPDMGRRYRSHPPKGEGRRSGGRAALPRGSRERVSDGHADVAHDGVDLPAEEDHGGDHDDRDES